MHSLYKQGNLPYLSVKLCENCQKLIPINADCCPNCSYNFTSKTMDKPLAIKKEKKVEEYKPIDNYVKEQQIQTSTPVANENKKEEKFLFCNNCGSKIIGSQRYCGGCGVKVSKRLCPSCNEVIDADLMFCSYCGEKLMDSPIQQVVQPVQSNVTPAETVVTNQPTNNTITVRFEGLDRKVETEEKKEEVVLAPLPEVVPAPVEEEKSEEIVAFEGINMGRKRLFVIIQFFVVALIAAIMVMVPILTKQNLFVALIPCFTGETTETLINGIGVYEYIAECISKGGISVGEGSVAYGMITNESGAFIFTNIKVLEPLMKVADGYENLEFLFSIGSVLLSYFLIVLSMLIVFISSIVGLFSKKPFKGKALGSLTIMLFISCILIYINVFFDAFKKYDSWLIYAFALCFLLWFIIKLVFLKENKLYKAHKRQLKEQTK